MSASEVLSLALGVVSALVATASALFAVLARREAERARDRARIAEHTLDRVLGRRRG